MSTCSDRRAAPRRQRGEMLLEALIAVLITSVIAAGLAHVQARLMADQRATKVERLVVGQLREQLQSAGTGLCGSGNVTLPLASDLQRDARITCVDVGNLQVGVAGALLAVGAPPRIDLSVSAADLHMEAGEVGEAAVDLLVSSQQ